MVCVGQWWEMEPEFHVRRFTFYSESNGEPLEDFKYGNKKSNLHLGKITLATLQITLKGVKHEVEKPIRGLYQWYR